MRIIGGELKGKKIFFVKNSLTRPLKDSVKENIFNIITHSNILNVNIQESNVLDLYSGIGSFGLECLSRGSKKVTFVEQNDEAVNSLKKNIKNLALSGKTEVNSEKITQFLSSKIRKKFKIFFLDPPFSLNEYLNDLKLIKKNKIFEKNHIIIIHRERNQLDNFEGLLDALTIKKYGRSKIIFGKFLL